MCSLYTLLSLASLLLGVTADCTHNNCLRALIADSRPSRPTAQDCSSFLAVTVTPAPITFTATSFITQTALLTSVATEIETSVVLSTDTETATSIATKNVVSTIQTTATVTHVVPRAATDVPAIPSYASACSGAPAYSSACSCIGIFPWTVTASAASTTTTITSIVPATTVSLSTQTLVTLVTSVRSKTTTVLSTTTSSRTVTATVATTTQDYCPTSTYFALKVHISGNAHDGQYVALRQSDVFAFEKSTILTPSLGQAGVFYLDADGHLVTVDGQFYADTSAVSSSYPMLFDTQDTIEYPGFSRRYLTCFGNGPITDPATILSCVSGPLSVLKYCPFVDPIVFYNPSSQSIGCPDMTFTVVQVCVD